MNPTVKFRSVFPPIIVMHKIQHLNLSLIIEVQTHHLRILYIYIKSRIKITMECWTLICRERYVKDMTDTYIPHVQGTKLSAGLWTSNPVHMPKASLIKYSHVESYQQRQHGLFSKGKKSNRYISILDYNQKRFKFSLWNGKKNKLQFSAAILSVFIPR